MIEPAFHLRLDFRLPEGLDEFDVDDMVDRILVLGHGGQCEVFIGNAACDPYVEGIYKTLKKAEAAEGRITRYLRRRKAIT